jgi:hypothetical protein
MKDRWTTQNLPTNKTMMLHRSFLLLAFSALATAFTTRSNAFLGSSVRYVARKLLPFVLRL